MSLLGLTVLVMVVLAAGYVLYGTFIARQYRLDDTAVTPAVAKADGVDFVPARPFYLAGQHFSAIAAAGPIVGPIAACLAFGWLPAILWILLGVIFIGAVHDFSSLIASVRHGAGSIAEIARRNLGKRAWLALLAFIWLALLYVIVSFADVTASTFVGTSEDVAGLSGPFNRGGAVAAASVMYLGLALVMGLVVKKLAPPMWLVTLIFVPATLVAVWFGTRVSTVLVFDVRTWHVAILVYCFAASMLPLWLLQQPRGYLGGFVLYLALAVGVIGLLFGGYAIQRPMIVHRPGGADGVNLLSWLGGDTGGLEASALMFPFLFVTIACGACSGFHGLVCCGTTSKQIAKESDCKPVGFGCMLLEGFVAVIALATVMIVAPSPDDKRLPPAIYGDGIAQFLTVLLGKDAMVFARTFGAMAVATFIFDTLDVATRLGRYLLQELTGVKSRVGGVMAAAATAFIPLGILFTAPTGSWRTFWTLFGSSNQLLAALTLMGVSVWLHRSGKRCWYTFLPMCFVLVVTVCALGAQIVEGVRLAGSQGWLAPKPLNAIVASALLVLAVGFSFEALRAVRRGRLEPGMAA
jgi:carbon starvation protein